MMDGNRIKTCAALVAITAMTFAVLAGSTRTSSARTGLHALHAGTMTISVPGVPGPYCMYGIEKRLRALPEVAHVELLWREDKIRVVPASGATLRAADLRRALERAQYPDHYTIEP